MKNVNINTIAKEAGVSQTTVSRVINESGYVNYKTKLKSSSNQTFKSFPK